MRLDSSWTLVRTFDAANKVDETPLDLAIDFHERMPLEVFNLMSRAHFEAGGDPPLRLCAAVQFTRKKCCRAAESWR